MPLTPDHAPTARALRLRRRGDFTRVLRRGRRARRGVVGVSVAANDLEHPRIGLAVGRRVGNAVQRNAVKRRLRVILRALLVDDARRPAPGSSTPQDIVVTAYEGAYGVPYARLREDVRAAAVACRALPGALEGDVPPTQPRRNG
jgi:ribonuclease P protein component